MNDLPLRALYTVGDLARAAGVQPRRMGRILEQAGVSFVWSGRARLVSLSELERKVPPLWEGIKAAYALGGGDEP
jgi:hypothetical protein